MKKIFKILIVMLAVCFIMPQIALASWWNPFSWDIWNVFKKPQIQTVIPAKKSDVSNNNIDLKKFLPALPTKTSNVPQSNKTPSTQKTQPPVQVIEVNYHDQLISSYKNALDSLKMDLFLYETYKSIRGDSIAFEEKSISLLQPPSAYTDPAAVQIYQLEINEDNIISQIWQNRISQSKGLQDRLTTEMLLVVDNITEPEYLIRQDEIKNLMVFDPMTESTSVDNSVYFTWSKRKEINDGIAQRAENAIAWAQGELSRINTDMSNTTIYTPLVVPEPIASAQLQPSSINCNTTRINGNPQITCTDSWTLKSMVCDGTYTSTGGSDPSYHCYSR